MPSIEVQDLVVRYGARVAVDRVSFVVDPGEVVALLGRNGAGKTTTVETLEGYRRPDEGRVRVLGLDPVAHHDALVGRIGVMLQGGGLYPMMPPERAIRLFAAYYEHPRDPAELVELLGLAEVARTPASRVASASGCRSRSRSSAGPRSSSSTSPRRASTRVAASSSGASSPTCVPRGPPSCSPRTSSPRPSASPTGW
jgi:ABC-type lipopolysaccharide export system ATPase subunit